VIQVAAHEVNVHWDLPRLSDNAIVVRGGQMFIDDMSYNAAQVLDEAGLSGICGGAGGARRSALTVARGMPYKGSWYCAARVGELRREGFNVVMIDDWPHCLILLKSPDTSINWEGWERLRSVFSEPRPSGN
jgi:hypothetical protein